MYEIPTFKNNKYISHTQTPIKLFVSDVKIKSLFRFNNDKGYLLGIYIPDSINRDIITELKDIDKNTFNTILENSHTWFEKTFNKEDLMMLYEPSFCSQSSTISLILSNDALGHCTFNDKHLDNVEDLINIFRNNKKLKECMINLHIYHHGLYFYKEKAVCKWFIKQVNITEISYEKCYWIKEDIEEKLRDNVLQIKNRIMHKIDKLNTDLNNIEKDYQNIHQNKNWMEAVDKINKNIMLLEEAIK